MEDVKKLAEGINAKLDGYEAKMTDINKKIEEVKSKGDSFDKLETELKGLNELHTKSTDELARIVKYQEDLQKHIDTLDVKMQRGGGSQGSDLKAKMTEKMDDLKRMQTAGGSISFEAKASDMTISSNVVGDVPSFTKLGGVFYDPTRVRHIREFMNIIPIAGSTLYYDQETAYSDGAGVRGEGSSATQSDFTITEQSETVRNISTYLTLSKEMFNDVSFAEAYIRSRVGSKLMNKEDQQILYGTGLSNQLNGITTVASAYSDLLGNSTVNRYDVLFNATINATNNEYRPTLITLNPTDYMKLSLTKDSQGNYLFPLTISGSQGITINGAQVLMSTAVTAGDFIVGDFRLGATFGQREALGFTFSNQHSDNLIKGKITVFVEERVVLGVHNTNAFVYGDFASALAQGTA